MGTCYCERGDRIIDVGCDRENGKFLLRGLPDCLPSLFTARFRAPADAPDGRAVDWRNAGTRPNGAEIWIILFIATSKNARNTGT